MTGADKRINGIYYTPDALAKHLAEPLIKGSHLSIFDPSYGQGALLLASEAISREAPHKQVLDLYGCDLHPVNGLLTHLPEANLIEQDFFEFQAKKKFDVILTNPPYIRHQNQLKEKVGYYKGRDKDLFLLNNSADVWAYFMIKCIKHLKEEGSIGAILPWAFIQAGYSKELRIWLADQFEEIKFLALNNPYFDAAQERVVMLWLKGLGKKNKSISAAFAKDFRDDVSYINISATDWKADRVLSIPSKGINHLFAQLSKDLGFQRLGEFAKARIGVVTGANKYFVRSSEYCISNGFSESQCLPILSNAKEFAEVLKTGSQNLKKLLLLEQDEAEQFPSFIEEGIKSEFHLRSHSKARKCWHQIDTGIVPDAFFPYRVGKLPYMLLNDHQIQSTNSIHRIYFDGLGKNEMKWVFISLLSVYGQLSIAVNAKTYGRGMLKLEPGALMKTFALKRKESSVNKFYDQTLTLLASGDKEAAVEVCTQFIDQALNIPSHLNQLARRSWSNIQDAYQR